MCVYVRVCVCVVACVCVFVCVSMCVHMFACGCVYMRIFNACVKLVYAHLFVYMLASICVYS